MVGLDLADLDRSALQHRLAQHAELEDDLGSLPDMIYDGSMTEGMSSYAGMRKDSVGTTTDGDRTPDSISLGRGDDKENQERGSVRASGKVEVSLAEWFVHFFLAFRC